jgi:hypothetical protein
MQRLKRFLGAALLAVASACTTTPTGQVEPSQAAINAATTSYLALDQAILAADAAVKAGSLKGADAKNALAGFTEAKAGLDLALLTLRAANSASIPASGATK